MLRALAECPLEASRGGYDDLELSRREPPRVDTEFGTAPLGRLGNGQPASLGRVASSCCQRYQNGSPDGGEPIYEPRVSRCATRWLTSPTAPRIASFCESQPVDPSPERDAQVSIRAPGAVPRSSIRARRRLTPDRTTHWDHSRRGSRTLYNFRLTHPPPSRPRPKTPSLPGRCSWAPIPDCH